ncbi:TPA: helix-turn-helix domain-containing protein [Citrobacter amalonaticus]|nr:helix-turn-helix domain-containing protein [Citrobacter amalonaticus]HED1793703.1 helix-turn-helix domain-containing protein [Citrobacter amalonaticus]
MSISTEVIDDLVKWIDKNLDQPLRINEIALRSGYSKWHLQRLFLQKMGMNLGRYIRERKLFLAAQDLIKTDAKVCDISIKYGYDSQQAFTRIFSQTFKLSPGAYRRLNKS